MDQNLGDFTKATIFRHDGGLGRGDFDPHALGCTVIIIMTMRSHSKILYLVKGPQDMQVLSNMRLSLLKEAEKKCIFAKLTRYVTSL
jgi:hypothetical protein